MQSLRCFPSFTIKFQARTRPDLQGSPPNAQWSLSKSGDSGALCKCKAASRIVARSLTAQSLRSVVVKGSRYCVTSSAGPSQPEGANARTLDRKRIANDVVAVLPKLVGAAALYMVALKLQGTRRLSNLYLHHTVQVGEIAGMLIPILREQS